MRVRQDLPRPLVSVSGELDLASAGLLTAMLDHVRRGQGRHAERESGLRCADIDVDLTQVTFADSHGLAPVLDGQTTILAASGPVRRVLRLLQALPCVDDVPAAPEPTGRPSLPWG